MVKLAEAKFAENVHMLNRSSPEQLKYRHSLNEKRKEDSVFRNRCSPERSALIRLENEVDNHLKKRT